jgi:DNA-binding transcriptional LysR family regulator
LSGLGPIKQLVQRGVGLSVLPPAVVANEVQLGQLHAIPIARPALVRTVALARRRNEHPTPAAAAMEASILQVAGRASVMPDSLHSMQATGRAT